MGNHVQEAIIGITEFAQSELGDIVHVDIAQVGTSFNKGEGISGIESVKTAADVYAPVSGQVIAHNDKVNSDPAIVNVASETDGWIVKIKVSDDKDI